LRAAADFLDTLEPTDQVAAAPLNHGGTIQFTSEHAGVKKYLQTLTGTASPPVQHFNVGLIEALAIADGSRTRLDQVVLRECGQTLSRYENPRRLAENEGLRDPCPVQVEQESRATAQQFRSDARLSLEALRRMIARLGEIEGPKTLVLVSEGLVAEPQLVDLTDVGASALAARVTIYVLQLETPVFEAAESKVSPSLVGDQQVRTDGLIRLADSARGALFRLVGSDPYPFKRILTELQGYYLVAFEAVDTDRDGKTHRIAVSARVPDAIVRARQSFSIPEAPATPGAATARIERLLRSPRLASELPLRLAAYTFRAASGDAFSVLLTTETDVPGPDREVTVAYILVNDKGVVLSSGGGQTEGGRFSAAATLPSGRYLLKAAAIDRGGRQGSVERRFVAELSGSGAIRLSDFMLIEPPSATAKVRPTIVRATGERLQAYLEMYAPTGWSPSADGVTIEITSAGGSDSLFNVPATFGAAGPGTWIVRADIPLNLLPPGNYVAAARITTTGAPASRLVRPFVVVAH
jgi:hypothetical protein